MKVLDVRCRSRQCARKSTQVREKAHTREVRGIWGGGVSEFSCSGVKGLQDILYREQSSLGTLSKTAFP